MKNYTIFDVAKWFLNIDCNMSHKKLQKLCWYAYSWDRFINYNAEKSKLDETFIKNERVEAWVHGPVFPNLYDNVRYNNQTKIKSASSNLSNEFNTFLTKIYETYGSYTGEELESISHQELPWINARKNINNFERCNNEMQLNDIISEYSNRYV